MKKLNETVSNELLHVLKEQMSFDWIDDTVCVTFYAKYERPEYMIGKFYSLEQMGEYLLEKFTVKAYKTRVEDSQFNCSFVEIAIVLNIQ